MQHSALKRRLLALSVSGLFLGAVLLIYGFAYSINDDTTMVSILNGSYCGTPDGHAIFVKYPLSWVIKTLYSLTASVPWYPVVMMLIYWLAMGFLLCQFYARFPGHSTLISALFVGGMSLLWMNQIVRFTFSTCGAFVAAAVSLSYALIRREEDLKISKLGPLLLLFWLSYCIRDYFALASLLFLAIVWLSKYYDRLFREPKCWLIPVVGVAGLALCIGCNTLAYSSPEWQAYLDYNDQRSYVQDYAGVPSYSKNLELYDSIGYTERERKAVASYHYVLLEDFGPETFQRIYEYTKSHESTPSPAKTLKKSLKTTVKHYLLFDKEDIRPLQAASLAVPAALLLMALFLSVKDKKHYWIFPLMILFGLGCMWLYISYNGRYPPRVALSLRIITVLASLAGFAILFTHRPVHPGKWWKRGTGRGILLGLSLAAVLLGGALSWQEVGHVSVPERAAYYVYADQHPDSIFLRDTRLTYDSQEDSPSTNVISTGSWLHYSPLFYQKIALFGQTEVHRSILLQPEVYLIAGADKDVRVLLGLEEDTPLVYETVAELDGVCIYQFSSIG
ncbi:MAG: hypothetical protein ACI3VN_04320 [Candidatus Onthomonas sp.]